MFNDQQLIWLLRVIKVPNQLKSNPAGVGMKTKQERGRVRRERGEGRERGERGRRNHSYFVNDT